jgi:hypothetical protein
MNFAIMLPLTPESARYRLGHQMSVFALGDVITCLALRA